MDITCPRFELCHGHIWKPKLKEMLKANGLLVGPRGDHPSHAYDDPFAVVAGKQVRELGIGVYAGSDEFEFVAEAIGMENAPGLRSN